MAFTPGSQQGSLNGTTNVTVVSAPAASTQRQISQIVIFNADTVSHTIGVYYNDGVVRQTHQELLTAGQTLTIGGFVLDGTGDSIEADAAAAATTTAPTFVSTYADLS